MDGTLLWRINLGINIRSGSHYTQFMVYDLDSDGDAEVVCKTADGTIDGQGIVIGSSSADYRNSGGYILSGPEYLTVFSGITGRALETTSYIPARGNVADWGDSYGNRVDRFLACVAYLDGVRPSVVMCRGYYTRIVCAAWDYRNGSLTHRWTFDTDNGYSSFAGQGNHNLAVGDVDGDGKDEIMYGSCAIDDNGTGLYTTGDGHGDAGHLSDINPNTPGLEYFMCHESANGSSIPGLSLRNAGTGSYNFTVAASGDIGRCLAADIDPNHIGYELWGSNGGGIRTCTGSVITTTQPTTAGGGWTYNFGVWWDGDVLRELYDRTVLTKWNAENNWTDRVSTLYNYGASSNNSTKYNPCLSADIMGDWREELILRHYENDKLIIFSTPHETSQRMYTLMHDPIYRLSVALQKVGYNMPPNLGFYFGTDMSTPPNPDITIVGAEGTAQVWMEAECGNAGSLWDILTDGNASNGKYVTVQSGTNSTSSAPSSTEGHITFDFDVSPGAYKLWARVITPSGNDDSFWIKIDDGSWLQWNDLGTNTAWTWLNVSNYNLSNGSHTLTIAYREDGALLDKLYIGNSTPSGTGSAATNCQAEGVTIPEGTYRITPVHSNKALDVSNCGTANGTNVQQWSWLNNDCQQWELTDVGNTAYRISPLNAPSKCLDVDGVSVADNANIHIWDYLGGENQQWKFVDAGSNRYQVISVNSNKCLDVASASSDDGANLQQYTCYESTNQMFYLEAINEVSVSLTIQENETGFCSVDGSIDTNNAGYTGSGFANTSNASGTGITWSVNVPSAGNYTLVWQYANGGSTDRTGNLMVDGSTVISNVSMPSTGSWTTWSSTSDLTISLPVGTSLIRLEANTSSGLSNVDYMTITGVGVTAVSCDGQKSAVVGSDLNQDNSVEVTCYPIPVSGLLTIDFGTELENAAIIHVLDITGKTIIIDEACGNEHTLDMSNLPKGSYFVRISNTELNVMKHVLKD